jgi:hypothetical protein
MLKLTLEKFELRGVPLDTELGLDDPRFDRDTLTSLVSQALRPDSTTRAGYGSRDCARIADAIIAQRDELNHG